LERVRMGMGKCSESKLKRLRVRTGLWWGDGGGYLCVSRLLSREFGSEEGRGRGRVGRDFWRGGCSGVVGGMRKKGVEVNSMREGARLGGYGEKGMGRELKISFVIFYWGGLESGRAAGWEEG